MTDLTITLSPDAIDAIAVRVADINRGGGHAPTIVIASPYLTITEASAYLRCKPQRLYDLLSSGRLTRFKDGTRVLVLRAEVDAHLAGVGAKRIPPVSAEPSRTDAGRRLAA